MGDPFGLEAILPIDVNTRIELCKSCLFGFGRNNYGDHDLSPKLVIMFGNDEHPRHLIT